MLMFARSFLLLSALAGACAVQAQGIYVCIDDKGRRLTSDRPIAECREKEQREMNPSGTTRRIVKPVQTELEKKEEEAKKKQALEVRAAAEEEKRKNRAFVQRYPNQAAHDKERNAALAQIDQVTATAQNRVVDLAKERKGLDLELEFYKKDITKAPVKLRRQFEENDKNAEAQKRFINEQQNEKSRVNARFDAELARLKQLWTQASTGTAAAAAPALETAENQAAVEAAKPKR